MITKFLKRYFVHMSWRQVLLFYQYKTNHKSCKNVVLLLAALKELLYICCICSKMASMLKMAVFSWRSSREWIPFGDFCTCAIVKNLVIIMENGVKYNFLEYVWSSDNVFRFLVWLKVTFYKAVVFTSISMSTAASTISRTRYFTIHSNEATSIFHYRLVRNHTTGSLLLVTTFYCQLIERRFSWPIPNYRLSRQGKWFFC